MGLAIDTVTGTTLSGFRPGAMNWSVPDGCVTVLFSQMNFSAWNYAGGVVSADERLLVQKIRQYIQLVLFLIGAPSNVVNMAVFYKQSLKDRVMLCLFFLAFTDAFYLSVSAAFQAEELYNLFLSRAGIGPFLTSLINNQVLIIFGLYYASPVLSAVIAVERCLCVFTPLKFQTLLRTRTMALVILLVYIAVYALSFVQFNRYRIGCLYDPVFGIRVMLPFESDFYRANAALINVMEGIVLGVGVSGGTMGVVAVATVLTIIKLRHIRKWRSETSFSSSGQLALTKMLVLSSILFVICLTPFTVFNVVRFFFPEVDYGRRDHNLFLCCQWTCDAVLLIKPCSNIFVYYTMGSRYRETLRTMVGRKVKKQPSS